jgi:RNA polymerase sigma-70 factor, ECF subfamily
MIFRKKIPDTLSDRDLLNKFGATNDLEYLSDLYGRYSHLVYGVCLKYLHEREASKDAVLEIFDHLRTTVNRFEIQNFKNWLLTLSRNHCLMLLRKRKKEIKILYIEDFNEDYFVENDSFEHLINQKTKNIMIEGLQDTIERLDENQKICIKLFYLENKSYKEIFDLTGFSLKQVKSYIQNGKRNLKNLLSEEGAKVDLV